ncbi:MAG TPA: rhomboid family intramembrane serine protease [Egibacteraceae bacterium]|jgi:membrane associated rhomboid family serine protease|nr:rhomboid family intramembrane serine protease [Egibacteraceae bacterium]
MVIPLGDRNPTRRRPWVTWFLVAANIGVFAFVQPWWADGCTQREFFLAYAAIPVELVQGQPLDAGQVAQALPPGCDVQPVPDKPVYAAGVFSLFLHGGWLHLLFNMLYLWVFGNNVEDRLGHLRYAGFYVVCGLLATAAFVVPNADSPVTLVGASGAIAGVLGAYLVMFPRVPVTVTVPVLLFLIVRLPAALVLLMWFVGQLLPLGQPMGSGGVAYLAHVGGFVAGVVIVLLLGHRPERRRRRAEATPGWPGGYR